jgi:formylglycine-generating enzyme required for sulfatase activity
VKTCLFRKFLLPAVLASLGLMLAGRATAQLTITLSGTNVVLTWPTNNTAGLILQSTLNLGAAAVWNPVYPAPVVVNGPNTVTNPISDTRQFYRLIPPGMALVPAGSFTMGDTLDGEYDAAPATNVYVSAFYMDTNLVSSNQWAAVYSYATGHGYTFVDAGAGKAGNNPVDMVDWYDCVKWSNARSQQTGLTPVYYTDAGLTQLFTNGEPTNIFANWTANGFRLPTEAEWEKAARGGLSEQRFPWGDTISESQANYYAYPAEYVFDLGPYTGYNTNFDIGAEPYTSPVGSFAANGYGLYDMAGNVYEWCWDWYAGPPYPAGSPYLGGTNPTGAATGIVRVSRGGFWAYYAIYESCASRNDFPPTDASSYLGFRCVRGP